jgi:Domain of unknown function (DUF2760)
MSRIGVAFSSFFGLLFRGKLPPEAALYLPPEAAPPGPPPALPPVVAAPPPSGAASDRPSSPSSSASSGASRADGALLLLGLLQREGRLVDFLRESLEQHPDAAIGAAVRDVHRGCRKVLEEHVRLEPVMPGSEDGPVVVPRGFDPTEVRLIGLASGEPPFRGTLVHHGWRAIDVRLPTLSDGVDRRVVAPAEVRLP